MSEEAHECPYCDEEFPRQAQLNGHIGGKHSRSGVPAGAGFWDLIKAAQEKVPEGVEVTVRIAKR